MNFKELLPENVFNKKTLIWLVVIFIVMLWLRFDIFYNSPFTEECKFLFSGRTMLHEGILPPQALTFNSIVPYFIYGIVDALGGELAGRIFALLLGFASLYFFFKFNDILLESKPAAAAATLLLAIQTPHIMISKFATDDILALTFFTAFLWLGIKSLKDEKNNLIYTFIAIIIFVLSVLTKYALIVYFPIFAVIYILKNKKNGLIFLFSAAILLLIYFFLNKPEIIASTGKFFSGDYTFNAKYTRIVLIGLSYIGIPMILFAIAYSERLDLRLKPSVLNTLILLAIPFAGYHLIFQERMTIYKHIIYILIFLTPVAGLLLKDYFESRGSYRKSVIVIFFACTVLSIFQVKQFEDSYPNTEKIINFLKQNMNSSSRVLAEDPYLLGYYFYPYLKYEQISSFKFLDYNRDGKFQDRDVMDATSYGRFDYVVMNGLIYPELSVTLRERYLRFKYEKIFYLDYKNTNVIYPLAEGTYYIYSLRGSTMLAQR